MVDAQQFLHQAQAQGFSLFTGVPCSYLKPLINAVIDSPRLCYVGAANEGDAVAIATGAQLAGQRAAVLMQNSGLGNAVSPLTSLNAVFKIPVLLICTLRGEPGGPHDEPQHALMGPITTKMLEVMEIPWAWFPTQNAQIGPALQQAVETMSRGLPYALVMRKDSVAPYKLNSSPQKLALLASPPPGHENHDGQLPSRKEALTALRDALPPDDTLIATTGFTGRVLWTLGDRANQFYMVGSMGCASSIALGLALSRPDRRFVVIDGDGAALMRLGALTTIGYQRPANLLHVVLDNEVHDSTGAQPTVSHSVDLGSLAVACGYPRLVRVQKTQQLRQAVADWKSELTFIHLKTRPGEASDLPRPTITPVEVAARFSCWLSTTTSNQATEDIKGFS